ncbi:hypothetical protein OSB04_009890 [Centaurea solstitialis]|uniref:Reverse transcriptase zinc-binding domain-containing protein n=1 Tax=Centaurea solstitialis TaxID=347529 RepID=A0AA38WNS9_9ASTR|nr:hypothetical protein OSB04_009890 [Centaurea solstitialis]
MKETRIEELGNMIRLATLSDKEDKWNWEGDDSGVFSVKSLRLFLDNVLNSPFAGFRCWNNWLPPKVNCFVWRLLLNRIPTRSNLRSRGISLSLDACPLCLVEEETVEHLFHSCTVVSDVWKWFCKWCKLSMEQHTSLDHLISSLIDHGTSDKGKKFIHGGCNRVHSLVRVES